MFGTFHTQRPRAQRVADTLDLHCRQVDICTVGRLTDKKSVLQNRCTASQNACDRGTRSFKQKSLLDRKQGKRAVRVGPAATFLSVSGTHCNCCSDLLQAPLGTLSKRHISCSLQTPGAAWLCSCGQPVWLRLESEAQAGAGAAQGARQDAPELYTSCQAGQNRAARETACIRGRAAG